MRTISAGRHQGAVHRTALLIDRDAHTADRARRVLRRAGYHVASSPDAAVEHVARARPDLVVLALHPGDAHAAVAFLQELRRSSPVPLMVTTPETGEATLSTWLRCADGVEEVREGRAVETTALSRVVEALRRVRPEVALLWTSRLGRAASPAPVRIGVREARRWYEADGDARQD